jgi:serine O-acetyltransferase
MLRDLLPNGIRHLITPAAPAGGVGAPNDGYPRLAAANVSKSIDTRPAGELGTLELLAEDFATHDRDWLEPGFWAVATHRIGRHASHTQTKPVRAVLEAAYKTMFTGIDWIWGIHLPRSVELGRRVRLWHNGCMLLTARSIGNDVHIRHDTTFGPVRGVAGGPATLPVIDDRADIGSGACVLGGVLVGHDAVVGANSVVLKNVPPHSTVLGVPARIVPT